MAGDPPFFAPLIWPVGHVALLLSGAVEPQGLKAKPELDLTGHVTSVCGALRSFLMAVAVIYGLYGEGQYPAFGRGKVLEWAWIWPILLRNVLATWLICGFWDGLLYFGLGSQRLKERLSKYKINPKYPSTGQIVHDALATTSASIMAGLLEALCCYCWCNGLFPKIEADIWAQPVKTLLWAALITHWRVPHFHAIHRVMHPWRVQGIPDVGKFLYRHIHAMHHKSYNPTAFSGTNMHPVESTLYYSACLIAVPFGVHPAVVLGCIIDCGVGAWLGHDGFRWPGTGDYFHLLHHAHFDCNYGATHVPLDKWFGTYVGCKEDLQKVWRNAPAGPAANGVSTDQASKGD